MDTTSTQGARLRALWTVWREFESPWAHKQATIRGTAPKAAPQLFRPREDAPLRITACVGSLARIRWLVLDSDWPEEGLVCRMRSDAGCATRRWAVRRRQRKSKTGAVSIASLVVGVTWYLATSALALAAEVVPIEPTDHAAMTPFAIGEGGRVVGNGTVDGLERGLVWSAGVFTTLPPPPGHDKSYAYDINDEGVAVGEALGFHDDPDPQNQYYLRHAVKWGSNGTPVDIGPDFGPQNAPGDPPPDSRPSTAYAITDGGAIFGMSGRGVVRFNGDGSVTSPWRPDCTSDLLGVSPNGTEVLLSQDRGTGYCPGLPSACSTNFHPCPLLVTAGSPVSVADCIREGRLSYHQVANGSTVVGPGAWDDTGDYDRMPVRWHAGTCTHLPVPAGTLGGNTYAINSAGVIVGTTSRPDGGHGVIWSADGTLAYIDDLLAENSPWHIIDGRDISDDGWILARGIKNGQGNFVDVVLKPMITQVPPDLDQAAPAQLSTYATGTGAAQRFRLAFKAAVDNIGGGPLLIRGHRTSTAKPDMTADQLVPRSDGSKRTYPNVGALRFSDPNWRLRSFDHYELRRPSDYKLLRGRTAGFCLRDVYNTDPAHRLAGEPGTAVFTTKCGLNKPNLLSLSEGLSVGFGVFYQQSQKSEFVDVTGLAGGQYYLVHRVNESHKLVETSYTNNASSLLIQLRYPNGTGKKPSVSVLKKCPNKAACPA
jgi:uncharacterized membrane protein